MAIVRIGKRKYESSKLDSNVKQPEVKKKDVEVVKGKKGKKQGE